MVDDDPFESNEYEDKSTTNATSIRFMEKEKRKRIRSTNLCKFIGKIIDESLLSLSFANHRRHLILEMTYDVGMYLSRSSTFHEFVDLKNVRINNITVHIYPSLLQGIT